MKTVKIKVSDVVFREDLYPRIKTNAEVVQKYAEDLSVLPHIEINQNKELIDGWHRWTAHKKAGADDMIAIVVETKSDAELLEFAIERNAKHGLQLSQADKRDMARRIYGQTPEKDRDGCKKRLSSILSVSDRTIREWLSNIDKDAKEARDRRIFDLWLSCWTQEEIAAEVGYSRQEVTKQIETFATNGGSSVYGKTQRLQANHEVDFDAPVYNIWRKSEKSHNLNHFGNTEVQWLDNLLYLYTKPFDVVVDPFAGSGSTMDVCRKRMRRYFISDRKPIIEREKDIRKHDVSTDGIPKPPQWKDVSLVYLDPPYWKQAEGRYSKDKTDLANMTIEDFNESLSGLIGDFAKKLDKSHIAMVMQPTQWNAPKRQIVDHVADMIRMVKLPIVARYSAPYSTEQCTPQMVDWAKENKQCLVLTREIVVWSV